MAKPRSKKLKDLPEMAKLNARQQKFVHAKAEGKTDKEAVLEAGFKPGTEVLAKQYGEKLMRKPTVRMALAELIAERHPDMSKDATNALQRILRGTSIAPVELTCPHCQKSFVHELEQVDVSKDANVLKAIDMLAKIQGDYAPTKSARLVATVDKYKLPEE